MAVLSLASLLLVGFVLTSADKVSVASGMVCVCVCVCVCVRVSVCVPACVRDIASQSEAPAV